MDSLPCTSCELMSQDVSDFSETPSIASTCQECGRKPLSKVSFVQTQDLLPEEESLAQNDETLDSKECIVQNKGRGRPQIEISEDGKCFACDTCGKKFRGKHNLIVHFRIHTGEKEFSCTYCEKKFRHKNTLKCHLRVHTKEKNYECPICQKKFTYKSSQRDHMSIHAASSGKTFKCEICQKVYTSVRYLRRHKKRNICDNGGKIVSYRHKPHFQETFDKCAMPLPAGERGYSCLICGKRYLSRGSMRKHVLFHTGESVHTCEYCGKEFQEKKHLRIHTTIHTGDRKHLCNVCGKRFSQRSHLRAHMKGHTGEKSFACGECGKLFRIKAELRRHMIHHTGDDREKHLCEICGKQYIDKYSYGRHKKTHEDAEFQGENEDDDLSENELVKCDLCNAIIEKISFEEHCQYHLNNDELEPCPLDIVKSEMLCEDTILEREELNTNIDLTDKDREVINPLEMVKSEMLPDDKVIENEELITTNDLNTHSKLRDETVFIKKEPQCSEDETSFLDKSFHVKMETEDV